MITVPDTATATQTVREAVEEFYIHKAASDHWVGVANWYVTQSGFDAEFFEDTWALASLEWEYAMDALGRAIRGGH